MHKIPILCDILKATKLGGRPYLPHLENSLRKPPESHVTQNWPIRQQCPFFLKSKFF